MPIVLASKDPELAERCRRAVSAEHPFELTDSYSGLLHKVAALAPSIVLVDAEILARPIDEQLGEIVAQAATARVIVLNAEFREDEELAVLKAGAKGCCRRGIDPDSLRRVLSVTETGGVWVTRNLLPRLVTELRRYAATQRKAATQPLPERLKGLSPREREIVRLVAAGSTNKEVASALDITERTVKGHLSNVFQKLNVTDRLKLVLYVKGG